MAKKSVERPISEITLRKYEKPSKNMDKRELCKKICLSLGLLQPGDTRDTIVDILHILLKAKQPLTASEIIAKSAKNRKKYKLSDLGLTYPNVSRQLRRLKDLMIIESRADKYRLNENDKLKNIFNEKIMGFYLESVKERINLYLDEL